MNSESIRLGGLAAVLGGLLFVASFAAFMLMEGGPLEGTFLAQHWGEQVLSVPMNALLALGVVGLYGYQAGRLGKPGKVGSYVAVAGFALAALGGLATFAFELGVGEGSTPMWLDMITHPLAMLLMVLGSMVFGVATYRAALLPRGGALLVVIGPLVLLGLLFGGIENALLLAPAALFGLGWAWLGYGLVSRREGTVARPPRPAVR